MDKRERFDDIFRERLYDVEYSPTEVAWEGISARLPRRRLVHGWVRRVAAVAALFLLAVGGMLFWWHTNEDDISGLAVIQKNKPISGLPKTNAVLHVEPLKMSELPPCTHGNEVLSKQSVRECTVMLLDSTLYLLPREERESFISLASHDNASLIKKASRKWRIGVGSGNMGLAGVSLNNGGDMVAMEGVWNDNSNPNDEDEPLLSRATSTPSYLPERSTRVKHSMPISFGVSLSYPINERWSFQTGLTYTYLRSKWKYVSSDRVVQKQSLHFLGIPVSVNYRLTHWYRPHCYFNAGILAEVNVAGELKNSYGHERIRIPGVLWTTYARVGVAYPLIRFVSIYAEGGICYYFDYKGTIETKRSENAFNFTGQLGLRLNF